MTQQEIGESLGISRETTSITFRHLTEAGIIVQKGGKFIFIDKQKLNSKLSEKA
jgi:DNA-binding transcriptional regulator YhcF (GntR family)